MSISLYKTFLGISDYVNRHDSNYTILEDNINAILVQLGGASGSLSVPAGLQEIFDRDGVIGIDSYQLTDQTVPGSDEVVIPAGAAWLALTFRAKTTTTTLNTAALTTGTRYINVDSGGFPSLNDSPTAESVYSFAWDSGTQVISSTTLLIDILFDGSDYFDCLSSTAQAKNFTSLGARLEDIEGQLGVLGAQYAEDTTAHSGLSFGYASGVVRNDNVIATTVAGTIALTDSVNNFIEITPSTGVITTNTSGFTSLRIPLFEATPSGTVAGGTVTDRRTWASLGGGGGGGGHAQNTDTGTDAAEFKLNNLVAGAPTLNASFKAERGTSADVDIRWNETTNIWEFTNDGTLYNPLGAPDLGVQELSKLVVFEDPPEVLTRTGVSSEGYLDVDLTLDADFTSIVSGVSGMMLRVEFDDDVADGTTVCLFKQIENGIDEPLNSTRVFARDTADIDATRGVSIMITGQGIDISDNFVLGFQYKLTASGVGTANLKVFVLGYWEKVTGVGSQDFTFTSVGNSGPAGVTQFNLPGFVNRGLVHSFTANETSGTPTLGYNIKTYKKDTFVAGDLTYQVDGILPGGGPPNWVDTLPYVEIDEDVSAELHMTIENLDASTGTYDITIRMERFA
tara:strand:- start:41062 stop:42933 length:1872 start_codon:yes stop_codon:yes gene_type:complete